MLSVWPRVYDSLLNGYLVAVDLFSRVGDVGGQWYFRLIASLSIVVFLNDWATCSIVGIRASCLWRMGWRYVTLPSGVSRHYVFRMAIMACRESAWVVREMLIIFTLFLNESVSGLGEISLCERYRERT